MRAVRRAGCLLAVVLAALVSANDSDAINFRNLSPRAKELFKQMSPLHKRIQEEAGPRYMELVEEFRKITERTAAFLGDFNRATERVQSARTFEKRYAAVDMAIGVGDSGLQLCGDMERGKKPLLVAFDDSFALLAQLTELRKQLDALGERDATELGALFANATEERLAALRENRRKLLAAFEVVRGGCSDMRKGSDGLKRLQAEFR
jgi:hypothetical protein